MLNTRPNQILVCALALVSSLTSLVSCGNYNGLFIMVSGTKSHMNFFTGIIDALLEDGHKLTFVGPYESKNWSENLTQISVQSSHEGKLLGSSFQISPFDLLKNMYYIMPPVCINVTQEPKIKEALQRDYDYVILSLFFTDCLLGYVHEKKVPLIYASPNNLMDPYSSRLGQPEFLSVTPNRITNFAYPLNFRERVISTATSVVSYIGSLIIENRYESLSREIGIWSPSSPSIGELQTQASLALINSVRALESPIKMVPPSVIYAGGIHIKPSKPLSTDLEEWINESGEHGFIYFSLGTKVNSSFMDADHLAIILNVFESLKQRIVWKWDPHAIKDLPSNVKVMPWLPQQDILAHPKLKLFISHGGLFSSQESVYHGVPMIGMPVFGDQFNNVAQIVAEGWGHRVTWEELTEDTLRGVIIDTITNKNFRNTVTQKSELMKDWPFGAKGEVAHWVNYVVRHDGAKHLRSPFVQMPWYEIYNVDVWLCLAAATTLTFFIIGVLMRSSARFFYHRLLRLRPSKSKQD